MDILQNPQFWGLVLGYYVFSSAVGAMESPDANSSKAYRFVFRFLNTLAGNLARAFTGKIPGLKEPGNGAT